MSFAPEPPAPPRPPAPWEQPVTWGRWQPLDLAAPEYATPPTPPADELCGLLYRGKRHVVSGPSESAKTLVVWALALGGLRAGIRVACVDFEMGPPATRRLLVDLGATVEELAAIVYFEPDTAPADADIEALAAAADLVIIDAAAGAYDVSGLDDNKRQDAERFARAWIVPLWQRGITTILVDHVTKNAEARGRYAIGSERKLGQADVHLGIETVKTLTRGGNGLVKVAVHKDRPGFLSRPHAAEISLASDPNTHRITWTIGEPSTAPGDTFQPTVLMQRVSTYLEQQGEPVSLATVEGAVRGKSREWIRKAVQALLDDGYLTETRGPRGARMLTLTRPHTTSPDLAPTSPGEYSPDLAHLARPLQGGEVRGEVRCEPDEDDLAEIARLEAIAATLTAEGQLDASEDSSTLSEPRTAEMPRVEGAPSS